MVGVGEGLGVFVGLGVAVGVWVLVAVGVAVGVRVGVEVVVGVGESVGVVVAVGSRVAVRVGSVAGGGAVGVKVGGGGSVSTGGSRGVAVAVGRGESGESSRMMGRWAVVLILLAPAWDELWRPIQPAVMMTARPSHVRFDMIIPFPCLDAGGGPGRRRRWAGARYGIS